MNYFCYDECTLTGGMAIMWSCRIGHDIDIFSSQDDIALKMHNYLCDI